MKHPLKTPRQLEMLLKRWKGHAVSNGEEGIGNAVVIGLIPSTQGLYLSPEGLRYIIVLFLSGWSAFYKRSWRRNDGSAKNF